MTVLDVSNNRVTQVKSLESDGYAAIQVTYGTRRATRVVKPQAGHYAKAGAEAGSILKEFRLDPLAPPNSRLVRSSPWNPCSKPASRST